MDKLQMAHDWAMKIIEGNMRAADACDLVERAWKYADAMQAEADKRKPSGLPEALKEEWQPDWSQAPEWASSWGVAEIGQAWWFSGEWYENNRGGFSSIGPARAEKAPSFNYQGNWQNSLRKRPQ